jgi:hypothetical protein
MNRSFHAFAVLLVSLAGGMLAATWTSMLPGSRPAWRRQAAVHAPAAPLYCSCNPESQARFEKGCARDKTTGELYGCGLGLGNNGTTGKSVLGSTANASVDTVIHAAVSIHRGLAVVPWDELAVQSYQLEQSLAAMQQRLQPEAIPDRSHERDYAAAELAAAGVVTNQSNSTSLNLTKRMLLAYQAISAESISRSTSTTLGVIERINRQWERESRLWLVERGLHRYWDDAEEAAFREEQLAAARMLIDEEDFGRWFENFPPPVTRPNRLINPIEPKDESEESRRIILATAKALEALSGLLHQTAENLARHAEQDVAELHKLKSGIEERR